MHLIAFLVGAAAFVVVVITLFDLFAHRHLGWKAAGWAVLILIVPFIGAIIYWGVRPTSSDELERAQRAGDALRQRPVEYGSDLTRSSERDHF